MADEQITRIQKAVGILLLIVLAFMPISAGAQVVISEIMYDVPGTEGSGEHDWVEIFNSGTSAVDVSGYRFFEANTNHTLKLDRGSDTIPAGGYAVIASATSTFLTDWPAFAGTLFDSSFNLNSTGELIGIRVDSADTGNDFTYAPSDTATNSGNSIQLSGGSWIAASPTPGAANAGASSAPPSNASSNTDSNTETATASVNTSAPVSSYVAPPEPQLFADAGDNRTVIVAADTEFLGRAYNRKKETVSGRIRFLWNFGDGSTAEGQSVLHHFEYPGRYAVTLSIAENFDAASERIIITAEPARLAFASLPDGSIAIGNNAGRDLDLSGWIVSSFGRSFTVPKDSIILAGESLRIGEKTLGFRSSPDAELDYPNGGLALKAGTASAEPNRAISNTPAPAPVSTPPASKAPVATLPVLPEQDAVQTSEVPEAVSDVQASSSQVASIGTVVPDSSPYLWLFGVLGLAVAGGGALVASRHAGKREWDIVEEREG